MNHFVQPGAFRFGQTPMDDKITYTNHDAGNKDNNGKPVFDSVTGQTWNNALAVGITEAKHGSKRWEAMADIGTSMRS